MRKTLTAVGAAKLAGYLLPSVLALLGLTAAIAAPKVAPVNIDQPTITGVPRV
jgi:hypothetical protein